MQTVSFTAMVNGTQADYDLLTHYEEMYLADLPDRIFAALRALERSFPGYLVSRLEHSLQSATRAQRDGRDEEYVVAALCHDLGDELAPHTHGEMVGAILRPYVRPELTWVVKHHGVFQLHYTGRFYGVDPDAREAFRDNPWFDACVEFCERYDQNCFDPDYESLPLEFFEPMVRRVFAEVRYLADDALV